MNDFFIFYAPFIALVGGLVVAFWIAPKDHSIQKEEE